MLHKAEQEEVYGAALRGVGLPKVVAIPWLCEDLCASGCWSLDPFLVERHVHR